jgi:hypothetical protein
MANVVITHTATVTHPNAGADSESATVHDAQPSKHIIDGLGGQWSTHSPKLTSES